MSLTPALDQQEAQRKKDRIELCGKNRGPHDYIPIEWKYSKPSSELEPFLMQTKRVTRLLCRTCFSHVTMKTLIENYPDVSYEEIGDKGK